MQRESHVLMKRKTRAKLAKLLRGGGDKSLGDERRAL